MIVVQWNLLNAEGNRLRGLQNTGDTPLFCRTCEWKVMCEDQCRTLSEELFTSHDRRDFWRS
ncbi:hypothetical protein T05_5253 [Trichinella murrelli]|uniref:Uncharacterized protein n=1 Tax=Trichinella murrelli TaxID=144512 RepID=A0A0V0UDY3_9BILA|nr:hypothetical protein T05_5253 [Trichinella murrelli]